MNIENSDHINEDVDLETFSNEFYNVAQEEAEVEVAEVADAEDTSSEDLDALATEEADEPEAEPDDNEGEEETPPEKPKGKQTAQERIREINAKFREEERLRAQEREYYERRIKELEAAPKQEEAPTQKPVNEVGEPTADDLNEDGTDKYPLGDFDPQLAADRAKFHVEQAWKAKEAEQEAKRAHEARVAEETKALEVWEQRLQEAETGDIPLIRDHAKTIITEFQSLPKDYGDYLADTLISLEKGPEVMAYLADNIDEARRIVASGQIAATIALGELQSMFKKSEGNKQTKPRVTQAPEPPKNLTRGSNGRFEVPDDTDDQDAFEAKFFRRK